MASHNEFISYLDNNVKTPQITDFVVFQNAANSVKTIDVSTDSSSEEYVWGFDTKKPSVSDDQKLTKLSAYKSFFVTNLLTENLVDNIDSELIAFVEKQLTTNRLIFLTWLSNLFWEYQKNEDFVVKMLDLLMCFSYDEVQPYASHLALACKYINSTTIQSKNLSLLGHWCNQRALEIICDFEEPKNPWMSIKYNRLKEIIQSRCSTSEK